MQRTLNQRRFISKQALSLRENVRKLDYDNFLCGLLLPNKSRDGFFAIRAFNAEIARIKDSARSNPGAGKLRLQWWRQRLQGLYTGDAPTDHFLLAELHAAIHKHQLTQRWFDRILEAREVDLEVENPETLRDIELYAEKTAGSMIHLTLECLGVRDDTADIAARNAGISVGIATLLRGARFHARGKSVYLPEEVLKKHQLTMDDVLLAADDSYEGSATLRPKIVPASFEVACRAVEKMREAQQLKSSLPREAIPAFYTTVSSQMFLKRLEEYQFDIFHEELLESKPHKLQFALLKHSLFRYY